MWIFRRSGLIGVLTAVALVAGLITGSPAHADYEYKLKITHGGWFVADFCLNTQSYDENNRDTRVSCTGRKGVGEYEVSVSTREDYRVWLDVHVVAGTNGFQITMHNGYLERVGEHVFNTRECDITDAATTLVWWINCRRDDKGWKEYWHSRG